MKRREFLRQTARTCAGLAISRAVPLLADAATSTGWRSFEVTTRVEVLKPSGITHIWLPAALIRNTPFQKTLANKFAAEGGTAALSERIFVWKAMSSITLMILATLLLESRTAVIDATI